MRRVAARMVESTRNAPGILCALQDDGAAPPAATQPTPSLPPLKIWPIIAAIGLLVSALIVDGAVIVVTIHFIGLPTFKAMPWTVLYFGHTGILLATLLCIALLGHGRFREFGFKAPADNRYVHAALLFGVLFGIVMTAADYTQNIIAHRPPENFPLSSTNLVGSLTFAGLYGGTVEEILFRGLLMTFLMQRMSGRFRLGRFDVHVAGVIVAVLFSLAHLGSFWTESFRVAASQQVYAFVFGVIYAYWFEKSGSLLPAIIGHNLGNLVEYIFGFLMVSRWS
jgi:membrane protease YdiL (CAAX protease family)